MPLVSVIIPAYNRGDVLSRTIESVLSQTFRDFELIIVDDGSTDNTKTVIYNLAKKDNRIKYIWQSNSGGASAPKNTGFKQSCGKYIAYLDHDDEWFAEKLEKQIKKFEEDPTLGIVSCDVIISSQGKEKVLKMKPYKCPENLLLSPSKYVFSNSSAIIPRRVIEKVGERDQSLKTNEDHDMFFRIALAGYNIGFVDKPLVKYNIHEQNLSKDFKKVSNDYEIFLHKYNYILKQYPKTHGICLRHLASMYFMAGNIKLGKKYFQKSIKTNPSFRNIITATISILGRDIYLKILNFKQKIV